MISKEFMELIGIPVLTEEIRKEKIRKVIETPNRILNKNILKFCGSNQKDIIVSLMKKGFEENSLVDFRNEKYKLMFFHPHFNNIETVLIRYYKKNKIKDIAHVHDWMVDDIKKI